MYKGVVYEVGRRYIIVHADDGRYLKLKKKPTSVGSYIAFFEKDILKTDTKKVVSILSMAALLMLAFFIQPLVLPSRDVYGIVSLDHMSSISYEIDENGLVINMKAFNKEGEQLLDENDLGKSISEVLTSSIYRSFELGYIHDENTNILVSETLIDPNSHAYFIDDDILEEILAGKHSTSVYMIRPNHDVIKTAQAQDVSIGRMYLAEMIEKKTKESIEKILEESLDNMLENLDEQLEKSLGNMLEELDEQLDESLDHMLENLDEQLDKQIEESLDNILEELDEQLEELDHLIEDITFEVDHSIDEVQNNLEILQEKMPSVESIVNDVTFQILENIND